MSTPDPLAALRERLRQAYLHGANHIHPTLREVEGWLATLDATRPTDDDFDEAEVIEPHRPSGDEALRAALLGVAWFKSGEPCWCGATGRQEHFKECLAARAALTTPSSAPGVEGRHNHGTVWPACPACGTSAPDPNFPDHELVDKVDAEFH